MIKFNPFNMSLLSKMLFLDIFVATTMLILSVGLAARYSINMLERGLTQNLFNVAQLLATNEDVIESLEAHRLSPKLEKYLDTAILNQNNIDIITIADMKAVRIYHPNKAEIGRRFVGDDEADVLEGRHYHSKAFGTLGYQSRYLYPIFGKNGKQIGFVLVSMLMRNFEIL
jgi:sensor histidine kinase regulating citrate/malate metabolism